MGTRPEHGPPLGRAVPYTGDTLPDAGGPAWLLVGGRSRDPLIIRLKNVPVFETANVRFVLSSLLHF